MLEIRTFRSRRRGIRVDLLRKYRHTDPDTHKVRFSFKQVGSFSLLEGYKSELLELLQPDEILQLQNWLAETHFAEHFDLEADALEKISIRFPGTLLEALNKLYLEAKRIDIEFIPHKIMLQALLNKAQLVQQKIDKINGFPSHILETVGIDTQKSHTVTQEELADRALFKALLTLNSNIGKTCTEVERAAKKYGKHQRIPPPQLREWAGDIPSRNTEKRIKKWCYAVAIDVLQEHGQNPANIIPAERIAIYWALQKQESLTLEEAQKMFIQLFSIPSEKQSQVQEAISDVYRHV